MTAHPYMRRLGRRRLDGGPAAFWSYGFANEVGPAGAGWETFDMGPAEPLTPSIRAFWDKAAMIRGYGVAAPIATGLDKGADRATRPRKARRK